MDAQLDEAATTELVRTIAGAEGPGGRPRLLNVGSLDFVADIEGAAMTLRQEILEVVRDLTARGLAPFSPKHVIDELQGRGTQYAESSIRTHVVDIMCANAPSQDRATSYTDLRRVSHGKYVLASENDDSHDTVARTTPVQRRPATTGTSVGSAGERPWSWEGNVQRTFVEHLQSQGWDIISTADTASREQGADVIAKQGKRELVVEVKGLPDTAKPSANTQARHYAAGALLTALLAWADRPEAHVGLVFPEAKTFRTLMQRLRTVLEHLSISVWFVHRDGRVEHRLDAMASL